MKNDLHHFIAMKKTFTPPDGAAIHKMSEKQLCETFAQTTAISHGAFRVLGKLRHELEVKKGQDGIYAALAAYGIENEDISNAGPACATYRELVIAGHVKEAAYDTFTFGLCRAVMRVLGLSEKSPTKMKLTAEVVAEIIKTHKKNAQKELECVSAHGVTLAEYEQQQAEVAKAAKAAEAEAKKSGKSAPTTTAAESDEDEEASIGTQTHESNRPDKSDDDRAPREATPPKAKATGYARCNELLDELSDAVLDGVTPAEAGKLYERIAAFAQTLAEFAATGEPDPAPVAAVEIVADPRGTKPGRNGKDKPVLAA